MYDNPPCKALADVFEKVDTTDKENTLNVSIKNKIDAVITDQSDVSVPTVAYIAENLGLKGIGYEMALKFTNKYLMREYLRKELKDAIPEFKFFDNAKEAIAYCSSLPDASKKIIKPVNSQGSKGVFQLDSNKLNYQVSTAFTESRNRGVLVEEFLNGNEYSVEAFKSDNKVYNIAVTKKYHYISNDCIDERNTWLGDIDEELEKALFDLNTRVIETLGLPFGITHAEYKFHNGKPYLIEIAARGAGGSINSKVIPYLTNFIPNQALINTLLDRPQQIEIDAYKNKFAVLKFFNLSPGKIKKLIINETHLKDILEFNFNLKEGDSIVPVLDSRDRPGYFIVHGENYEQVIEWEKNVEESIQIEYEA
jgi:biotin carboxylase